MKQLLKVTQKATSQEKIARFQIIPVSDDVL